MVLGIPFASVASPLLKDKDNKADDRKYWVGMLVRVIHPVLSSLSQDKLKELMPVEVNGNGKDERSKVTHLEALGRTLAGVAPWLEVTVADPNESKQQQKYRELSVLAIQHAVNPASKCYLNFTDGKQPLVDAAFLAHALLRAPQVLWANLDKQTQQRLIKALQSTRSITPYYSNWLLFTAIIEAALLKFDGQCDFVRLEYAIREHQSWYKGDGVYGDGPDFHFDYYNSYVIQPMLLDTVRTVHEITSTMKEWLIEFVKRAQRYAEIQERLISPEGTFPPVGRSIAYRCGAFQLLAQMAFQEKLPGALVPAQVRGALTAVISKTLDRPDTFDSQGWLTIGLAGHQPEIGEQYISTGSLYLCTTAFLPLGLPASNIFWSGNEVEWTSKRAFSGKTFPIDKALS